MAPAVIYTIGYQGSDINEMKQALLLAGVDKVVDVRRHAVSRWRPSCSKSRLREALAAVAIGYEHMPQLGTPKDAREELKRTGDVAGFRRAYGTYLQQRDLELNHVCEMAEKSTLCLLCCEQDALRCHRSYLASQVAALSPNIRQVRHLGSKSPGEEHLRHCQDVSSPQPELR